MQQITYPYHVDGRGRTATTDPDPHIRDMIEQVLFTSPGERVMLPDFGCGIHELVFEPNSPGTIAVIVDLARDALIARFGLDELQVNAILQMQLRRLAALERQKIIEERDNLNR